MIYSSPRFIRLLASSLVVIAGLSTARAADGPRWIVDQAKSHLTFTGTQTGAPFEGSFKTYDADIVFDPDHLDASHINVSVDISSATTGDTQRDAALPGKDWFNAAETPKATFETVSISNKGGDSYEAAGSLSIRGVTKPAVLPFKLQIDGTNAHATGHLNLVRTDFGIGQGPWATDQWVALEVVVNLDIVATRSN